MHKMTAITAATVLAVWSQSASAAGVTFYVDEAAFDAATTDVAFTNESFTTQIPPSPQSTLDSGIVTTNLGGTWIVPDNASGGGNYGNVVGSDPAKSSQIINFLFPDPVNAVSFEFSVTGVQQLQVTAGGVASFVDLGLTADPVTGAAFGFFGFTSMDAITEMNFFNTQLDPVVFSLRNLDFGASETAAVPLPAGLPLLLVALGALGVVRRKV